MDYPADGPDPEVEVVSEVGLAGYRPPIFGCFYVVEAEVLYGVIGSMAK